VETKQADMLLKRTKKVPLGIFRTQIQLAIQQYRAKFSLVDEAPV